MISESIADENENRIVGHRWKCTGVEIRGGAMGGVGGEFRCV